jgi:hypothetical protein
MKARKVKHLDPDRPLRENAARIVATRLGELRSLGRAAARPEASDAQHDMRIAAKRLRYVLEVTGACFGGDATTARETAKDLQGVLGDLHDCDVLLPRVTAQIERLRDEDARALLLAAGGPGELEPGLVRQAPNRLAYRGLELLAVRLQARRALLFERFRDLWRSSEGVWAALEVSLAAAPGAEV